MKTKLSKEEQKYEREFQNREAERKEKEKAHRAALLAKLPKDFALIDLTYPSYTSGDKQVGEFGMYLVNGFGWCITTLLIKNASWRRPGANTSRFYAVRVSDGQTVRIGHGPHVTATVDIYVRESRKEKLQKYLDLKQKGLVDANVIRDRISSRRAQGALRRGNRISFF